MADDLYESAKKRYEELKVEMEELEAYLRAHDRVLARLKTKANVQADTGAATADGEQATIFGRPVSIRKRKRSPSRPLLAQKAREFMLRKGEPMTRGELVQAFLEAGMPIGGEDPGKNMGTMMWRLSDRFVNIEGYGYWPKDTPFESGGYKPEESAEVEENA